MKPLLEHEWVVNNDINATFFKCIRWQAEATMDPINCPYHYFCETTYSVGNYSPAVDILLLLFTTFSYMATLVSILTEIYRRKTHALDGQLRRYWVPSGALSLPIFLLAFAKGRRISTIFPISSTGPAILLLIQISALALDNETAGKDIGYAFLKASTISGILHASVDLDLTILPYYTGLDALVSSTFSGECMSCVCRKDVLVVGGKLFSYRGWSLTTFLVVGTLCLRIICRLSAVNRKGKTAVLKSLMENLGWIRITMDCVYLVKHPYPERSPSDCAAFAGLFVLICLHVLKKMCSWFIQCHSRCEKNDM